VDLGSRWVPSRSVVLLVRRADQLPDRATPFSDTLGKISPRFGNPFAATVVCWGICTVLGMTLQATAVKRARGEQVV